MIKIHQRVTSAALATALIAWAGSVEAQQGSVGRAVKQGFQNTGQAIQGGFQKTRTGVHNMEIVSRIYSRLHWDKALTTSNIELEVQAGGVAILTGIVPDGAAKTKALSLAADTVGVIQVVDQLTVAALTRPAPVVPGAAPVIVPAPASTIIVTPPGPTVITPGSRTRVTDTPR